MRKLKPNPEMTEGHNFPCFLFSFLPHPTERLPISRWGLEISWDYSDFQMTDQFSNGTSITLFTVSQKCVGSPPHRPGKSTWHSYPSIPNLVLANLPNTQLFYLSYVFKIYSFHLYPTFLSKRYSKQLTAFSSPSFYPHSSYMK